MGDRAGGPVAATTALPVAARELLRTSLLDAAREELRQRRWADVTMADVAATAGVSRQTLYKEFGSREEFAQALVLREADNLLDAVEQAMTTGGRSPPRGPGGRLRRLSHGRRREPAAAGRGSAPTERPSCWTLLTTHGEPLLERSSERLKHPCSMPAGR